MIEESFVTLLADLAPVYPAYLPQRADRPAIVYRRISANRILDHDGPTGDVAARFQFSAHAQTHPEALALHRATVARLNGYQGGVFDLVTIENELTLGFTPDADGWEFTLDALVKYKE